MLLSWESVQMYVLALVKKLLKDVLRNGTYAASYFALLCAAQVEAVYNPKAIDGVSRMSWLDDAARQFFKRQLASTVVRLWPPMTVNNSLDFKGLYPGCPQSERCFLRLVRRHRRNRHGGPHQTLLLDEWHSPSMLYGGLDWFFMAFLLNSLDEHKQYVHPNGSFDVAGSWLSEQSAEALKQKKYCAAPSRVSAVVGLHIIHLVFVEHFRNTFQCNLTSELTEKKECHFLPLYS
ncbi:hypothetical protein MRX96_025843 [Rhipicephalus microplus]